MKRKSFALVLAVASVALLSGASLWAQDFERTYALGAGGYVHIGNISGDVKIIGDRVDSIVVAGYKTGADRDLVKIEDSSSGDRLELRVQYPKVGHCDASVNFEVRVPASVQYNFERVSSVSGDVQISDIRGRLRAESVSGDVTISGVSGLVSASSISGDVDVEITHLEGDGEMKFSSVSGSVNVKAPANLDANIEMSSVSGSLKTDFPIEVLERRYGPGRSARGRLGGGASNLRITTVSGRVSLLRR